MKATGIVRRIDDLGRVVIPKEIRRTLRIREGEPLEIFTDREGEIILKKYSPIGELTKFAKEYTEAMAQITNCLVCITDQDQIVAAAGPDQKEYAGKEISKDLEQFITKRKNICISASSKEYVSILKDHSDKMEHQVIHTIICAGDAIGSVIMLANSKREALGDVETKLAAVAAEFLGKQMEN